MKTVLDFEKVADHGPQTYSASVSIGAEELARDEVIKLSDVRVEGSVDEGDRPDEFVVRGRLAYEADLMCARCLDPYPFANRSEFTLNYVPRPEVAAEESPVELEVSEEALDDEYYDEPRIDLKPIVLEQVQLSLPMKPLCDEGCQGLCPHCGTNMNRKPCDCRAEESDPRWDALRGIREDLAKKKEI